MIPSWLSPIAFVIFVAALLFGVAVWQRRRSQDALSQRRDPPTAQIDPAASLFANGNRPTEDDIAQARLGGSRGAIQLGAAPMVRQVAENTLPPADPGHVA
jgi:hypothetical protein